MRRIKIPNPTVDETYRTYINSDYSSGTALTVANNSSFAANDLALVGNPREELTEIKKVDSISVKTNLTLASTLSFAHPKNTPVYKILWDNVSIERRTSSAGVFAEITQSGLQYDNKLNLTIYFDSDATDSYEYRFRFYNSVTTTYSEYSPTLSGAAPSRRSVRYMIQQVRELANDLDRKIVSDMEIIRAINRGQDIIYTHNPKYFFLYVDTYESGSGSIATVAGTKKYSLNSLTNYGELAGIKYEYSSGGIDQIYRLEKKSEIEFDRIDSDQNMVNDDWSQIFKILPADDSSENGYFKVTPKMLSSGIGTFYPLYYRKMPNLDTVDDLTLVPLPDLLIDYAIGHVEQIKGNENKAKIYQSCLVLDDETRTPRGLVMLDKMDRAQKDAVGQPKSVWNFRGQKAIRRLFGNKVAPLQSPDYYRENYW